MLLNLVMWTAPPRKTFKMADRFWLKRCFFTWIHVEKDPDSICTGVCTDSQCVFVFSLSHTLIQHFNFNLHRAKSQPEASLSTLYNHSRTNWDRMTKTYNYDSICKIAVFYFLISVLFWCFTAHAQTRSLHSVTWCHWLAKTLQRKGLHSSTSAVN